MKFSAAILIPLLMFSQALSAQSYPSKAITIVVPFGPGGNPDIVTRTLQPKLSELLGVPVVVENRPGAGGNVGSAMVARAKPDGYTLLLGSINALTMNRYIYKDIGFDPSALTPIVFLGSSPSVLMATPGLGVKTVKELIELAKRKPGALSYASPGVGTSLHLSGELFKSMTGVSMTHVPYKSGPAALPDLLAGRVDLTFENILSAGKLSNDGRLRALAVTSKSRSPLLPDVPSLDEAGLPGFDVTAWVGFVAPPNTPRAIVDKLNAASVSALRDPGVIERFRALGFSPAGDTPDAFGAHIASESAKWQEVIRKANVKAE